jgi:hypothetical protein
MTDGLTLDAILKIGEIISIVGGGGIIVFKVGRVTTRVEEAIKSQADDIADLKADIKVVSKLLTEVAVQKTRLDSMDKRIDELRHGEGFGYPLSAHLKGQG